MKPSRFIIEKAGGNPASVFHDLDILQNTGTWPSGAVPAWARALADAWHCGPASSAVTSGGWEYIARFYHEKHER